MYKGTVLHGIAFDDYEPGGIRDLMCFLKENGLMDEEGFRQLSCQQQTKLLDPDTVKKIIKGKLDFKDVIESGVNPLNINEDRSTHTTSPRHKKPKVQNQEIYGISGPAAEISPEHSDLFIPEESDATHCNQGTTSRHFFSAASSETSTEGSCVMESSNEVSENSGARNKDVRRRKR